MGAFHNREIVVLPSAARTASLNSPDIENMNGRGVKVVIDVTADPAAASVVFTIQGKDPASGKYYDLLSSVAIDSVGTTVLTLYPHVDGVSNVSKNDVLPRHWRVKAVAADSDSLTYSVGACTIL